MTLELGDYDQNDPSNTVITVTQTFAVKTKESPNIFVIQKQQKDII